MELAIKTAAAMAAVLGGGLIGWMIGQILAYLLGPFLALAGVVFMTAVIYISYSKPK